jgi:Thiamine pyrophosphate enzyme, C-terminal TPP binding domain
MSKANLLERRSVVSTLLSQRKDAIVVGGLGASTYDIAAAGDNDRNFYLWGAMGGAVMIGLGIALAQPKLPVLVITGDGEMLMGMGSLATVGLQKPGNLTIIVLELRRNRRADQPYRISGRPRRRRPCLRDRRHPRDNDDGRGRSLRAVVTGCVSRAALCQRQDRRGESGAGAVQP